MSNFLNYSGNTGTTFTDHGTGGGTTFTLPLAASTNSVMLSIGGIMQQPVTDFSVSHLTITTTTAVTSGIEVLSWIVHKPGTAPVVLDRSISPAKIESTVINAQTGTSYTLVTGDEGKVITLSNTGTVTLTVPANSSEAFPVGAAIKFINLNTGDVNIEGAGGVTVRSADDKTIIATQYATCELQKIATDTWALSGDRAAQLVTSHASTGSPTVTTDGDFKVVKYTGSGTFTPTGSGAVELLVVAGGGGGAAGGGGAGGYRTSASTNVTNATSYTVTVGAGGSIGNHHSTGNGGNGSNSSFSTFASTGGGGAGDNGATAGTLPSGGSGGGEGEGSNQTQGSGNAGSYTPSEGNDGGQANDSASAYGCGGGGGASAVGANGSSSAGGAGGAGTANSITGSSVTYAGGGGGGFAVSGSDGAGGAGGGGAAGQPGNAGTANTGGGGGGGSTGYNPAGNGGLGGSGVVIIRYQFQ